VTGLNVLAVDDELPALDELQYLLGNTELVKDVVGARSATEALRHLRERTFDVVLADIAMPGLDGIELASILGRFSEPPAIVFVTAHEQHALEAFDVGAAGYLLKPLDQQRLVQVLRRVGQARGGEAEARPDPLDFVPVDAPGRTTLVARSEVVWVETAGDYVRLHTFDGRNLLIRTPMNRLEEAWNGEGFARIHRQYLVCLKAVRELRNEGPQMYVNVADHQLPVSRRHVRELRDRLVRHARTGH
jgi:DNA-binding LytR/AlgR family response regulator